MTCPSPPALSHGVRVYYWLLALGNQAIITVKIIAADGLALQCVVPFAVGFFPDTTIKRVVTLFVSCETDVSKCPADFKQFIKTLCGGYFFSSRIRILS